MKPLRKEAKIAIGASITVVILALIAVIVVVAVNSAKNITQMFGTVFTSVDDTVRDNRYIATIKNRYALMEGDKAIADNFTYLKFVEQLDGYLYAQDDGGSGILNKDGKVRYSYSISEINLRNAKHFSGDFVTLANGETYNLKTKAKAAALTGISPAQQNTNVYKYFTAVNGNYIIVSVSNNAAETILTDGGIVYDITTPIVPDIKLVASNGTNYVVQTDSSKCLVLDGSTLNIAEYQSAHVLSGESFIGFYAVDGTLYNSKFVDTGIKVAPSSTLQVFEYYLDSGESVYKCDGDSLNAVVKNAKLYRSINDTCYILGGSTTLYDLNGKLITSAASGNTIMAATDKFVFEGNIVRNIKGDKKITDVVEIYSENQTKFGGQQFDFGRDVVAKKTDGTIHSLKLGEIYGAAQIAKLGEINFTFENNNIIQFNSGYLLKNENGYYCNTNDTFYSKGSYNTIVEIGNNTNRDCFAIISSGNMHVYKIGKTVTSVTSLYYSAINVVSNHDNGLIYSSESALQGFINLEGKAIAEPVYKSITYADDYLIIELSSANVKGILSFSGKEVTSYNYVSIMPMGDYGCVAKPDGTYSVLNSSGREVLKNISAPSEMRNTTLVGGKYIIDKEFKYFKVCEPRGWRIIKTPTTAY